MTCAYRSEQDSLGRMDIPAQMLYGIHTARAMVNFPYSSRPVPPGFIRAYGLVKQACIQTCVELVEWANEPAKSDAMLRACAEMAAGLLDEPIRVDLFQGGAGTSLNMNVNEILANRALQILNLPLGSYDRVHPLEDINRYQSTNDTFPTALRVAAIKSIQQLEKVLVALQEAFQAKEKEFADIVKIGRTEYQDAVLTTLGREMSAYAEAINRDRWRIYKCIERLRVVNLGGTAIGSGLSAPRDYIFRVTETLRDLAGLGLARAENLIEATQNTDVFVEVSGILKACASSLLKISGDLRLLSSGPAGGLREITLPPRQAGSSIMPGKVNPVIPESVSQAAIQVLGNDVVISHACSAGSLELNAFLPVIAANLLESIELLTIASDILRKYCIEGIGANREQCRQYVENTTAVVTALLPKLGYDVCARIAKESEATGKSIRQLVIEQHLLTEQEFGAMISPEAVCQLGHPKKKSKTYKTMDQTTPKSLRLHIGIFGRRNVGKSSLLNAIVGQDVSIVSEHAGTTTDPVEKPMELLPLGPVVFIDTAGVDDEGALGQLRIARTRKVFERTDLAVIVSDGLWGGFEDAIAGQLTDLKIPYIALFNKIDQACPQQLVVDSLQSKKVPTLLVSAKEKRGLTEFRQALLDNAPAEFVENPAIVADLVGPGQTAILVVPIDKEAPKGRLILPQVQTIRDLLDGDACCMVVKERELRAAIDNLKEPPKLVVTDSQAFLKVAADTPKDVLMTSFSILFARFKGDLVTQTLGAMAVDNLKAGDPVLIAEACSHHPIGEDIGRVKIPRWLTHYVGGKLDFTILSGRDWPEDISKYKLIIHCGACMWNRRQMLSRLLECRKAGVPITNYGLVIAYSLGIFERALEPFPAASEVYRQLKQKEQAS